MINKIILFSLRNKHIILLGVSALLIVGIGAFRELSIDAVPDITNNQVQIITTAPSFAAQDIERKVSFPIEQACSNIAGIKEIRSFSRFGLSLITIVFDENVDIYWARQQVSERLQKVQNDIPVDIGKPELAPITTGLGEIYQYILRPEKGYEHLYSLTELREIQDWLVRRQLLGIKGVADVSSFGGKLKQYEISINPYQLSAQHLTLNDVLTALEKNNQNTGSAYIEKNSMAYFIRTEGLINSVQDIENITIARTESGVPIQIKDIGKVQISAMPRYGALVYASKDTDIPYEVAGGIVMMLKGENSNAVIERVKQRIEDIQKVLPKGIVIEPFLDRTKMVNSTIHTVAKNLLEGAMIVITVLVLFLGNIRYGLLVASVIPLSMLFTVILMNIFGVSGNLMSMGALDFGLIVDGAVIIVESILNRVSHLGTQRRLTVSVADQLVYHSASTMINAAVFGQLIILIVYLPVLYFSGIEGKMFRPMAQTVLFALTGAFILSVTYVPVVSSWLARSKSRHSRLSDILMKKIEQIYIRAFKRFFRKSQIYTAIFLVLFIVSILFLLRLGGEFMPVLEEGDFAVETRLMTGAGLSTTIDYCKKASALLVKEFPDEVEKIVSKIGSGEIPTDPMPIESADMMIILKPVHQWKQARSFDELAVKMQEKLQSVVGISTSFQYPVQMRFNELIASAKQDVVCKIFGENIDSLSKYAHQLAQTVRSINGVEGIYEEPVYGQTQILIQFQRDKLAQYNISVQDANKTVKTCVAGSIVGQLYENERRFDIVIRLDSTFRNIESIGNILINASDGILIPLKEIADINIQTDINQIQREDAKRRIIVGFNVRGRDVESVINELKEKIRHIHLPDGYYIRYGGSFENLESAKERLMITVPATLILIFVILYFTFSSLPLSILIYTTIPMSVIGGIFFLHIRHIPFSVSAGVGFIALFGIAVLNGIVLIAQFQQLRQQQYSPIKIILAGIKKRLRPVLMTATVASLGFLPMFLNTGIGANVQRPLATVVIGGLISSTLLTLFILPVLYYYFILSKSPKKIVPPSYLVLLFLTLFSHISSAQSVTYQMCIDSALKYNGQLKQQKILADYQKELIHTGWNIHKTSVSIQYGQYNGIYNDNALQVQQSIAFPSVYFFQREILKNEWTMAQLQAELENKNIRTTVGKIFYDLIIYSEKIKRLYQTDSFYQEQLKRMEWRYNRGDVSRLEKDMLQNIAHQNKITLYQTENEKEKLLILLQVLTQVKPIKNIEYQSIKPTLNIPENFTGTHTHPFIRIYEQNLLRQTHKIKLEQSKLLPDIFVGYTNQSLTGWGTDNIYYPSSKRFQYIQAGIDIPLFFKSFKYKINAEKKLLQVANEQLEWQKKLFYSELEKLLSEYHTYQKLLNEYESNILPNARQIRETATLQYQKGNTSFMEWINYIQQNLIPEFDYLNHLQQYNHLVFQIQYYTSSSQ